MDAVEFLKEKNRMTKYKDNQCNIPCDDCMLSRTRNPYNLTCDKFIASYSEEAVKIVEQWSKEHPRKTYVNDFLEKFPNACILEQDGLYRPVGCIQNIYYNSPQCIHIKDCYECWNEPMEE